MIGDVKRDEKSQSKIFVYFIRGFWFHNMKTSYSPNISFFFVFIYFFFRMFYFILYLILYTMYRMWMKIKCNLSQYL